MSCQNPHNHQVAAVFDCDIRLASATLLPLRPSRRSVIADTMRGGDLRFVVASAVSEAELTEMVCSASDTAVNEEMLSDDLQSFQSLGQFERGLAEESS